MIDEKDSPFLKKIECRHCHGNGKVKFGRTCGRCRGTGFWLKSEDENVYKICNECHGTGFDRIDSVCRKCDGAGYFSWLDEVFPKPKIITYTGMTGYYISTYTFDVNYHPQFQNSVIAELAKNLSNHIDNEVLKQYSLTSSLSIPPTYCSYSTYSTSSQLYVKDLNGVLNDRNLS